MVRRTKADAAATRQALIYAAERCFSRLGVAGATLTKVAAEAGLTRGAIYWHFANKADLLDAVVAQVCVPLEAASGLGEHGVAGPADIEELRAGLHAALAWIASDERAQRVLRLIMLRTENAGEAAELLALKRREFQRGHARLRALFAQPPLRDRLRAGVTPEVAALTLQAVFNGVLLQHFVAPDLQNLVRDGTRQVDAVLRGLVVDELAEYDPRPATRVSRG